MTLVSSGYGARFNELFASTPEGGLIPEGPPPASPARPVGGIPQPPSSASAALSASKRAPDLGLLAGRWYSSLEIRHHLDTYYTNGGRYDHQNPVVHGRLQIGGQFYDGFADSYLTLGVFKETHSQQMMQRRPEAALDLYPVRLPMFTLLEYNLVQFPIRAEASGAKPEDVTDDYSDATVTIVGLNPLVKIPIIAGDARFDWKVSADGWTKFYSRKQYTNRASAPDDDGEHGHLYLSGGPEGRSKAAAEGGTTQAEPIEDYALHYQTELMTGPSFSPAALRALTVETTIHYHSRYEPIYERATKGPDVGRVSVHYDAERYSYYRLRLHYDLTDRVAVTNDFYHFHEGFFAGGERGPEYYRFRNIARLSCRL